ncbi:class I SAM-dependent methyltransferase [Saccharibacillus sp. CPCC 101409]|uniref:class I SAM-dependent methyltransferase n=1 Tax=Saccharibacillus sp. CPCC 101409 TaxID=3058041 RepID=UPI002673BD54|nr:class I SAM-dependent methyltransferase [Saccharibacillus sp. CPCC 101409]MDO3411247.1 class I SAM-dependent methyltransferase [Saccharibacillus sp. CPCC 101409]
MKRSETYWNEAFADPSFRPEHDGWLERYEPLLDRNAGPILDLGCGLGHNARTLHAAGYPVIACDLSETALERLRREQPELPVLRMDMAAGLPFADGSLQAAVADLSLHYFDEKTTFGIVRGIRRALREDGLLLCRLNAVEELKRAPDPSPTDEPYLYESEGILRRFFDREQIERFFPIAEWEPLHVQEYESDRYGRVKRLWEVGLRMI